MTTKIAVLMTCYNRVNTTLKCLEHLFEMNVPDNSELEVYLVDDNSPDNTGTVVKKKYPNVNVIQGSGDLFWNRGMHLAWKTASSIYNYDFYLWLNDDTFLFRDALQILLKNYIESKKAIIVGAVCSKFTGELTYSGLTNNGKKIIPNGLIQKAKDMNGNVVLISKQIYLINGNLDKLFHHALGDVDFGYRAIKKGIELYISEKYIGNCESNNRTNRCFNKELNLVVRLKELYKPGHHNPYYVFRFSVRHHGLLMALIILLSNHLRAFSPSLYSLLQKNINSKGV